MARNDRDQSGPGSIVDVVAHLAIWGRRAPRGFAHVEYHSEFARAEADRRLGEALLREQVPYHRVELPVRATPSQAGRYLLEHLEQIESGTVSITGFATAVAEEDRRDLLAILSVRREVLAGLGLCQIWWLTPDFREMLLHLAPDLDSWFMVRLRLEEDALPAIEVAGGPPRPRGVTDRVEDALRRAEELVGRFHRAGEVGDRGPELLELAAAAADAIVGAGVPDRTRDLSGRLRAGLAGAGPARLAEALTIVRGLNALARWLVSEGRVREAKSLIDRAWTLVNEDEAPGRPELARDLPDLARLLLDSGRPGRAVAAMRRALATAERAHGPAHPGFARGLREMAVILGRSGRLREAEASARRALAIDEATYGPDHPEVATDLETLADLLRTLGRLTEAELILRRSLAIEERWFGPDHPGVATILDDLGAVLRSMGRLEEADSLLRRALAIDEAIYGPDHPAVARDRDQLASLLEAMNRPDEAGAIRRRTNGG